MTYHTIEVSPSAYTYPLLIKQLLHTPLAIAPDQEIVYADKRRHTYRELERRIHRLAHALTNLGVVRGDTVAVMDWDTHRYLDCFFGVPMLGAVLQTVNVRLSPDQVLYTLNHAQAKILLINREFLPLFEQIKSELNSARIFVLLDDEGGDIPADFSDEYENLLSHSADQFDFPDFDENTRATTFYTTGTTGLPKGVYFSHRQLVLHTLSVGLGLASSPKQGGFHRDDVYMPLTPMFHVHAWGMPYIATLAGVKQVYPGRYVPDTILKLVEKEKVTFSHCVPTILHMLLLAPYGKRVNLNGWKLIIGGSALTTALAKAATERGMDVFTGYGMSETCPILTFSQIDPVDYHLDDDSKNNIRIKTGRPVPLVNLRVVDAEMTSQPHDGKTTGEVVVRTPWVTQGYLNNPVSSEQLWEGGWLHTQDVGHINEKGYLYVTDRIKDVIKTGGEWISSLELEDIIGRHPAVSEVAVIGIPDEKWGERPLALVVLKGGLATTIHEDEIKNHVKAFAEQGHISKYGVPEQIQFVSELARTSVGKLNKKVMRLAVQK